MLHDALGYVVYGSDGRRIGTVIELVEGNEHRPDLVAIRADRVFLWRRRLLPTAAVAGVDPQRRLVSLLVDASGVERAHELKAEELREGWVTDGSRITPAHRFQTSQHLAPIASASLSGSRRFLTTSVRAPTLIGVTRSLRCPDRCRLTGVEPRFSAQSEFDTLQGSASASIPSSQQREGFQTLNSVPEAPVSGGNRNLKPFTAPTAVLSRAPQLSHDELKE